MSFLRHYLQQISRQLTECLPRKIRYVNADIIDKYQRIQDATIDTYRQRFETDNRKGEKFQMLRKLVNLLALSVAAGTTYKNCNAQQGILPKVNASGKSEEYHHDDFVIEEKPSIEPEERKRKSPINRIVDFEQQQQEDEEVQQQQQQLEEEEFYNNENTIVAYENRLRNFSSPEKIFRYFASICLESVKGTEILMTPADFLRSIYPGTKKPAHLGLDRFQRITRKDIDENLNLPLDKDSVFLKLGLKGLIAFADYLFLMTVLSTSSRHFEIAFQMFDINGDGVLNAREFEGVAILARQSASFAATGHDLHRKGVAISLLKYFFGPDLRGKLSIKEFLKFQRDLKREILSLEFDSKPCDEHGRISERDFADLLVAYAGYQPNEIDEKLRRVCKRFKHNQRGLSKADYIDFWELLNNLNDVEMALSFYQLAGASIDKATLQHVAKTVVKVGLSEHTIDVAFAIFDDNTREDRLSKLEFVDVMKRRLHRGLEWKLRPNFGEIVQALKKCAFERRSYDI